MISHGEYILIKEKVFEMIDFHFDGKIAVKKFDGVRVEYDGKNAILGCKDKSTLAKALFLLSINVSTGEFRITVRE